MPRRSRKLPSPDTIVSICKFCSTPITAHDAYYSWPVTRSKRPSFHAVYCQRNALQMCGNRKALVNLMFDIPHEQGLPQGPGLPKLAIQGTAAYSAVEGSAPTSAHKPHNYVRAFIKAYYARRAGDESVVLPENPITYSRRMRKAAQQP